MFQKSLLAREGAPFEAYTNCEFAGKVPREELFKEAVNYALSAKSDAA